MMTRSTGTYAIYSQARARTNGPYAFPSRGRRRSTENHGGRSEHGGFRIKNGESRTEDRGRCPERGVPRRPCCSRSSILGPRSCVRALLPGGSGHGFCLVGGWPDRRERPGRHRAGSLAAAADSSSHARSRRPRRMPNNQLSFVAGPNPSWPCCCRLRCTATSCPAAVPNPSLAAWNGVTIFSKPSRAGVGRSWPWTSATSRRSTDPCRCPTFRD